MSKFQPITFFDRRQGATGTDAASATRQGVATNGYQLMPFKFTELDADRFVMTNIAGEYLVLPKQQVREFADHTLSTSSDAYVDLRSHHFLVDANTSIAQDLLAIKLRTRYSRLANFTGLHIFVLTLRCEHSCPYCQVSRQNEDRGSFDMTQEQASAAIDLALRSPADAIKIEFQGGEPLLNFPLIQYIVHESKRRNNARKELGFVIATNLAIISDEVLAFCRVHEVHISTSLDGPRELHNGNRPRPGRDSYERVIEGLQRSRDAIGNG